MPAPERLPQLPVAWRFRAIGSPWQIDTRAPLPTDVAARVTARIEAFDTVYSRFRADSLVTRIASTPGTYQFPPDATALFGLYRELYEATEGAVTPLIGRALEHLGYDARYTLVTRGGGIPTPAWDDAIAWLDGTLTALTPVTVDVGAAGKGYLADLVAEVLKASGITEFTVDASGDIVQAGPGSIRVGLEHPLDPTRAIGIATLSEGALCASATNRRAWGSGLHHIVDVATGMPTKNVMATWVVARSGLIADGLSTALFFADTDRLLERFEFSWVRMFSNGQIERSPNFDGEVFT
jgi:thiamine biosynthesis lipoprotein